MSIGWGIVGIGNHADRFVAPAISKATDTKLVAVCSRSMERARGFADKHGADKCYDSLDKMLKDPEYDVLYIATPSSLHAEQTIQAAEAGKHVLCEKPMALKVSDCKLMMQACDKSKVKLGVNFQSRYHPAHIEARRFIQSGTLGKIDMVKGQFCRGLVRDDWKSWQNEPSVPKHWKPRQNELIDPSSDGVVGQGMHVIDLLRFLLDSEVEEVRAMTDEEPPQRPIDDMAYVLLKFENGVHGVVIAGLLAPRSDDGIVLYGHKAKITCNGTMGPRYSGLGELILDGYALNVRMTFPTDDHPVTAKYISVVEAFNKCIEENNEPDISGHNGFQMVRITNAILTSGRQGNAIRMRRFSEIGCRSSAKKA